MEGDENVMSSAPPGAAKAIGNPFINQINKLSRFCVVKFYVVAFILRCIQGDGKFSPFVGNLLFSCFYVVIVR